MSKPEKNELNSAVFYKNLPQSINIDGDEVEQRILKEYGAIFAAGKSVVPPDKLIFKTGREVSNYQASLSTTKENIGDFEIELQTAAMKALKDAIAEAEKTALTITPRGADSARRSYGETVALWESRVNPGLSHWVENGRIKEAEAAKIRSLSPFEQVPEIFRLESKGIFFSKDLSKSIIYSVAPPGTSQHLSMLALDVNEHNDPRVRSILAKYGWHQTVISDLPHFTFLDFPENQLSGLGLKQVSDGGRVFWIPDI